MKGQRPIGHSMIWLYSWKNAQDLSCNIHGRLLEPDPEEQAPVHNIDTEMLPKCPRYAVEIFW